MRKYILLLSASLCAGAVGGSLATYLVLAYERSHPAQVIRAQRFELIDAAAQTTSFWGRDGENVVLAFAAVNAAGSPRDLGINDPYSQRTTIGMLSDGSPFLRFTGKDKQLRVLLNLDDFERPGLLMSDGKLLGLTLGSVRSDTPAFRDRTERWVLSFLPEETARFGIFTEQQGSQVYVRGFSFVNPSKVKCQH